MQPLQELPSSGEELDSANKVRRAPAAAQPRGEDGEQEEIEDPQLRHMSKWATENLVFGEELRALPMPYKGKIWVCKLMDIFKEYSKVARGVDKGK